MPATSAAQNSLLFSAAAAYRTNKQTRQALSNLFYAFDIYDLVLRIFVKLRIYFILQFFFIFFDLFRVYRLSTEFIDFLQSLSTFYRVYWLSTKFIDFLPSLLTFYLLQWVLYQLFSNFTDFFLNLPILFGKFTVFSEFIEFLSTFYRVYRLLSFLLTLKLGIFCADFYRLYTDFSYRKP